jgi:hypothetical protein
MSMETEQADFGTPLEVWQNWRDRQFQIKVSDLAGELESFALPAAAHIAEDPTIAPAIAAHEALVALHVAIST